MPHHGVYNDNKWMSNGYILCERVWQTQCHKPSRIYQCVCREVLKTVPKRGAFPYDFNMLGIFL